MELRIIALILSLFVSLTASGKIVDIAAVTKCRGSLEVLNKVPQKFLISEKLKARLHKVGLNEEDLRDLLNFKVGEPLFINPPEPYYELLLSRDEINVYKIRVFRDLRLNEDVITNVYYPLSNHEQAEYYKDLALQEGISAYNFKLIFPAAIAHQGIIPAGIVAKIKMKHKMTTKEVSEAFSLPFWDKNMTIEKHQYQGVLQDRYVFSSKTLEGRDIKVTFIYQNNLLKILTAYTPN